MKAYKDENNDVWLFRPDQNYNRFTSAVRMAMPEVPEELYMSGGLTQLLQLDKEWIKRKRKCHVY
jgi:branched-chain amino acid aminotransferase